MIHLRIGERREVPPEERDPMGRTWVGYEPGMTAQAIYEQNRGLWRLGKPAHREKYAVFTDIAENRVRCVVEISHIESYGYKRAIVGEVLGPGDPTHDALIDQPAPTRWRNPMSYVEDPAAAPRACACGCGGAVPGGSTFLAGHDQRAVHARIRAHWGTSLAFIEWVDETFGDPNADSGKDAVRPEETP